MPEHRAAPSFDDVESAFLEDHWIYGGVAHKTTADALVAALAEPSEPQVGHVLFVRLFSEYVAALESYGAWGWALANRKARNGLMRAFLGYRNADVGQFYRAVEADASGDLTALLDLPSVLDAYATASAVATQAGMSLTEEEYRQTLDARYRNLKEAAEQWYTSDRVLVDTYNKAKHGATLVRLVGAENPRRFQVVLVDADALRYADFTVTSDLIRRLHKNVEAVTIWITELLALTKILRDAGRLY